MNSNHSMNGMFERVPELSADLEWMLQSGQVSREVLAELLVKEYFQQVYRLAVTYLDEPVEAIRATREAFSSALIQVYRYRSDTGIKAWLFGIAISVFRKKRQSLAENQATGEKLLRITDSLNSEIPPGQSQLYSSIWRIVDEASEDVRLPLILHFLMEWEIDEIASLLSISKNNVLTLMSLIWEKLEDAFVQSGFSLPENHERKLRKALNIRWPKSSISDSDIAKLIPKIISQSRKRGIRIRGLNSIKEAVWVTIVVLFVFGAIYSVNTFLPETIPTESPRQTQKFNGAVISRPMRTELPIRKTQEAWQGIFPTPPAAHAAPMSTEDGIFYHVKPGDTLLTIAAQLSISPSVLATFNRLEEGASLQPGLSLVIPPSQTPAAPSPTPVPASNSIAIEPTKPANTNDVNLLLKKGMAPDQTVWMDASIIHYGPKGFIGPPLIDRLQVWRSQDQYLVISGSSTGTPDEVLLGVNNRTYLAKPGKNSTFFKDFRETQNRSIDLVRNLELLFDSPFYPAISHINITYEFEGETMIGDHQVWEVQQMSDKKRLLSRLWIDAQTGFVLRRQFPDTQNPDQLESEVLVNSIASNVNFPQELFTPDVPWRGGYAKDYTGEPGIPESMQPYQDYEYYARKLPYILRPPNFDPSNSRLTFQASSIASSLEKLFKAHLFADQYYLGTVFLEDPWNLVCDRSSDGSKFAYVNSPNPLSSEDHRLRLINLRDPNLMTQTFPINIVTQFAFSPDNHFLAIFGYDDPTDHGTLYILDTENGTSRPLIAQDVLKSPVWSPDGKYIGFIGPGVGLLNVEEVKVINTTSGEIVYHQSIDFHNGYNAENWPMLQWGVDFPTEMHQLADCVLPSQSSSLSLASEGQ